MTVHHLPNGVTSVKVTEDGGYVDVRPANAFFPPRVQYKGRGRFTPLIPLDRIREFADRLDAPDRSALLDLLDALSPRVGGKA